MFNYKLMCDENFINNYEKEIRGNLLKAGCILVGVVDLLFLILTALYFIGTNRFNIGYFMILAAIIVLGEFITLIRYSSEKSKSTIDILRRSSNNDMCISIEESGVSIYADSLLRHIAWDGISEVRVNDKDIVFSYKVNGIGNNIFYFDFLKLLKRK